MVVTRVLVGLPSGRETPIELGRLIAAQTRADLAVRGSQFRAHGYVRALRDAQLHGAMGRVGACADPPWGASPACCSERPRPPALGHRDDLRAAAELGAVRVRGSECGVRRWT